MPEWVVQLIGVASSAVAGAGAAWVGIRVDLASMKVKVAHLERKVFGEVLP